MDPEDRPSARADIFKKLRRVAKQHNLMLTPQHTLRSKFSLPKPTSSVINNAPTSYVISDERRPSRAAVTIVPLAAIREDEEFEESAGPSSSSSAAAGASTSSASPAQQ